MNEDQLRREITDIRRMFSSALRAIGTFVIEVGLLVDPRSPQQVYMEKMQDQLESMTENMGGAFQMGEGGMDTSGLEDIFSEIDEGFQPSDESPFDSLEGLDGTEDVDPFGDDEDEDDPDVPSSS